MSRSEVDPKKEPVPACAYTADDVFNYSEDLAESISNPAMEQHLKDCRKCSAVLDGFMRVSDAAKQLRSSPSSSKRKSNRDAEKVPESIGGFKILGAIAEGGMGKVYKAYDASLDRFLALKVMKDELSDNVRFCERFISEAQTLAKLNHPNVVVGHTVGRHEGQLFIAMEYIDGKSLLEKINKRQLAIHDAIQTFLQILEGIKAAHEQQIIHRDIKPANIMITSTGLIKILDFGLAKEVLLGTPAASMETGMLLGTLAYMAPEVAMGLKATKQSDIFALGVVLYQMLTNWIPFIDSPTPFALIERIKTEPLRPPSQLNPAIPKSIEAVILKMCAKRPEDRYPTVAAVMRAISEQPLKELAKETPIRTLPWMEKSGDTSKFYFCESCGKRVTDVDLETGAGKDKKLKGVYCSLCAVGVMTMEFDGTPEIPARTSGPAAVSPSPGTRRPGSARAAAISQEKLIDRNQHAAKTTKVLRQQGTPTIAIVGGLAAACLLAVLLISQRNRAPLEPDAAPSPLAQNHESPKPAGAVPQPALPIAPAKSIEPSVSNALPVKTSNGPTIESVPKVDADALAKTQYDELLKALASKSNAIERNETVNAYLNEHGDSKFAKSARDQLTSIENPVSPQTTALPEKSTEPAKTTDPNKNGSEPETAIAATSAARKLFAAALTELTPLLNRNRFNDAEKLLDEKLRDPAFTSAAALLKKEKSDLAEMRLLRQRAVDALKAKKGTSVTLKIRGIPMTGAIKDEPGRPDVSLALRDGPEMAIKADQLDAQDVETYAPIDGSAKGQEHWRRGLLFLDAGDIGKAEDYFAKARDAGFKDAAIYLNRIASLKSGARETLALEAWKKAEALFTNKNWKAAKQAYESFQLDYAGLETLQANLETLKKRLDAIDEAMSPPKTPSLELGGGVKIDLILISPGEFSMGSEEGEAVEKPVHKVKITKPFYIGKYPITQAQYQKIMGKNPSEFKGENLPAEMVKFTDAEEFCKKVTALTGKAVRLPNEAEWEYACRAGTASRYYNGEHEPDAEPIVWHKGNSDGKTHPVGQKKPNAWGLYDMEGNVWEWCHDWFDGEYYSKSPPEDPIGPAQGTVRVLRGGAWRCNVWDCRSAARMGMSPDGTLSYIGFRIVVPLGKAP